MKMAQLIVEHDELKIRAAESCVLRALKKDSEIVDAVVEAAVAPPGYSGISEHSKPLHSILEHSMFFSFPFLFAAVFYHSTARLYELELLWLIAVAIPLSFVLGDLVTGIVHWAADTYGSYDTPIIGHSLIRPFRLHHLYPKDICTHNIVTTLGNSCIMGVPLLAVFLFFLLGEDVSGWLAFASLATAVLALVTVATNQFHKWAHQDEPAKLVRILQRARLVLGPANHQTHHTEPFDRYYCITNGWLNPVLSKLRFFRGLEAMLRWIGIRPTGRIE
jgi:ubiquitin-conjugating enzyme E2 variant